MSLAVLNLSAVVNLRLFKIFRLFLHLSAVSHLSTVLSVLKVTSIQEILTQKKQLKLYGPIIPLVVFPGENNNGVRGLCGHFSIWLVRSEITFERICSTMPKYLLEANKPGQKTKLF